MEKKPTLTFLYTQNKFKNIFFGQVTAVHIGKMPYL